MKTDVTDWLAEFAKALHVECGVVIEANDIPLLKSKFYKLRREHPELKVLSFVTSPDRPNEEAWIVRRPEETTDAENS
jgi:hypothetical protein